GSPLEKSTRYVSFGQKVKGDYRFYKEPRLLASQHRERYLNTCRTLFETYVQLNEPVREYVRSRLPRDPDAPAAAYERSVRALSFDLIRGLLPAATLTNMGVFGNGRFFESLISRLRIEPLQEFQDLAQTAWEELAKVVPSFIRRAHPDHRHFQSYAAFTKAQRQQIQSVAAQLEQGSSELLSPPARTSGEVCLVEWDADAEIKLLAALLYEHTALPLQQVQEQVRQMPNAERKRIFRESIALREHRRHKPPRALERVFYTFDLLGDYGMYRDLHRHRMLTQWRQPLTTRFGYDTPPELEDAGLTQTYHAAMAQAKETFEAIAADFPNEAQYVVPMAYRIRWSMHVNLRALTWLVELRSTPQGHPGYRHIAQALFREVQRVQSRLAEWMKFVDLDGYTLGRLDAEV
ncbi:MAG: FAD-dependent thymidylate synthase, partial [SAR324 cluster bacterium]|nr:FAD-dependent thymidylate synthase [SAR324 cluster bacterium]